MVFLDPLFDDTFGKVLEGSVVGSFGIFREKASRQLPFGKMIGDAVAADAFAAAWLIGAVALCQVFLFFAVHGFVPAAFNSPINLTRLQKDPFLQPITFRHPRIVSIVQRKNQTEHGRPVV